MRPGLLAGGAGQFRSVYTAQAEALGAGDLQAAVHGHDEGVAVHQYAFGEPTLRWAHSGGTRSRCARYV